MNFKNTHAPPALKTNRSNCYTHDVGTNVTGANTFKKLLKEGRISEFDLENLRLDIKKRHENKSVKTLIKTMTVLVLLIICILIFY